MDVRRMERELPKALVSWYDFEPDSRVLFISGGNQECEALYEVLEERKLAVCRLTADKISDAEGEYDYIVGAGVIERQEAPVPFLKRLCGLLHPAGKLLVGAENRLGIRYFCGDRDIYSGRVLDGIEGYRRVSEKCRRENGRAYSKAELTGMLEQAGFGKHKFYSVMPGLTRPQMFIAEDYLPNEPIDIRIFPQYGNPDTVFLEEEGLYGELMDNHMFHQMANAYFIECSVEGDVSETDQITVQGDRSPGEALATFLKKGREVRKRALYPEGRGKIQALLEKQEYLRGRHVPMVEARIEGDSYVMPYVEGQIATEYFQNLLLEDRGRFLRELGRFRQIILESSEHVPYEEVDWRRFDPDWEKRRDDDPDMNKWEKLAFGTEEQRQDIGVILKRGFVDMVSLNCFYRNGEFLFFDQEFDIENFPANAVFVRTIDIIYKDRYDLEKAYPRQEVFRYFHLLEHVNIWREQGYKFLDELRNEKYLQVYHCKWRRDCQTVAANRSRMNYSQEEYERLFNSFFKGVAGRKIYLFGSGKYARRFLGQFGGFFQITGIVDNDGKRWGESLEGIEIYPPSVLEKPDTPVKVFICVKAFEEVLRQLKGMGVRNYSLYNPGADYEMPEKTQDARLEDAAPKKYHIGYVAGVFDVFHIGHLNLLRRAKEQCDYLIVGVATDEQIIRKKKTRPYMPFKDRLEIVRACRYVDEAVEIPPDRPNTRDAYYEYHFDVQFSGSDYADNLFWLAQKAFLEQHGADMVFFPYTQSTSSTRLKERIREDAPD